jgi:glycolate oxidase FAD binding subunit
VTGDAVLDPVLQAFAQDVGTVDAVAVVGSRTRWDVGGPCDPAARLVRAPAGIVLYDPAEMIVTVRAGTTVADLHATLAEAGQTTALPDRGGTVGGALAVGESRIDELRVGDVRDALLRVRYVASSGELVSGGGQTVKNVSGFDLPRLMVSSLGTLGLIAEVTLRTNPIPPSTRWFLAEGLDPWSALSSLYRPSAILWDGATTWVCLAGHAADVESEHRVLARLGSIVEVDGPPPLPPHRWSIPAHQVRGLAATGCRFVASVGVGTVHADRPQPVRALPAALVALHHRIKSEFDPSGRLNPGRSPERR